MCRLIRFANLRRASSPTMALVVAMLCLLASCGSTDDSASNRAEPSIDILAPEDDSAVATPSAASTRPVTSLVPMMTWQWQLQGELNTSYDVAAAKGCDGVEPDNVTAANNATGFDITAEDQLDFNRFLADAAHARGLTIGLKNDVDQIP